MDWVHLSKTISYALRHGPATFGLTLGPGGWVGLDALLAGLARHEPKFACVTRADIVELVESSPKARFELEGAAIRARYGHSTETEEIDPPVDPPELLFHGTSSLAVLAIRTQGLLPMARRRVHLSSDQETAERVGQRRGPQPVILRIRAEQAAASGVRFFASNDTTWTSDPVPPSFIDFPD